MNVMMMIKANQQKLKKLLLIMRSVAAEKKLGNLTAGHHLRTRKKKPNKLMKVNVILSPLQAIYESGFFKIQ